MNSASSRVARAGDLNDVASAARRLDVWIEEQDFRGWDPHDALNSPVLRRLTLGSRIGGVLWLQLLKRFPINLRPLLRVDKGYNPKGMGLFLASYIRKYRMTRDQVDLERIDSFAKWLVEHAEQGYSGTCWGYNFDWPNRAFFAPAGTPTVVNTSFIALAFVDLHRLLNNDELGGAQPSVSGPTALETARSSCDFILRDLHALKPAADELCFSYTPLDRRLVHNASMLAAWLLAAVFRETGESRLADAALAAARYTLRRQRPDGSWPYGDAANDQWVDNFHTGFVLVALKRVADYLRTDEFDESLLCGYGFWKHNMFLAAGTPKYFPHKASPVDVHSIAQAVLTFLEFQDSDPEAVDWALRVCRWGIQNMQDPKGYFHYQIHRLYRVRIPYMRWGQAWMQRALTEIMWWSAQSRTIALIPENALCLD